MDQFTQMFSSPGFQDIGECIIHYAAKNGHTEVVKKLVACTVTPNAPNNYGTTPIQYAANDGHTEILKTLIACTDTPNAADDNGNTPIHDAASQGHTEFVKILVACTMLQIKKEILQFIIHSS